MSVRFNVRPLRQLFWWRVKVSDDGFQRFDGGLRLGCGVGYDLFYVDLTYDIGLSNICHDTFDTSHNGSLSLNFGVNF